jgi:hypothetical protein
VLHVNVCCVFGELAGVVIRAKAVLEEMARVWTSRSKEARSSDSSCLSRATVSLSSFSRARTTRTFSLFCCAFSTRSSSELKVANCQKWGVKFRQILLRSEFERMMSDVMLRIC